MATCIALHAHHKAALPIEFLLESYASRLEIINTVKATEEKPWQIELRRKLFRKILPADMPAWLSDLEKQINVLWKQYEKLWKQRDDLSKRFDDLLEQLDDLWKQYTDLWKQSEAQLIAYHDSICPCGWTHENNNIFNFPR